MEEDWNLIEAYTKGRKAFNEFTQKYFSHVVSIAYKYIGDESLSEDAAQLTFLKISQKKDISINANITTFLYEIAKNTAIDIARKKQSEKKSREEIDMDTFADSSCDCQTILMKAEEAKHLKACIKELERQDQIIVVLRFYAKWKLEDIAEAVGLSKANSASARLSNAYNALMLCLKNKGVNYE